MNPKQLLTFEQVKEFFSVTDEFTVIDDGEYVKVSYTDDDKTSSHNLLKTRITVQALIRTTSSVIWNHANNIFD